MPILYLKALHIIGFVTWFAGLFYLVRLFIYHREALEKNEPERHILTQQFALMEWRLFYIITWPGMLITLIFGFWMIWINPGYLQPWFFIKLFFIACLLLYHLICGHLMKTLKTGKTNWTSMKLRLWNELATLFLVAIVFLAVLRNSLHLAIGLVLFFGTGVLLMLLVKLYNRFRKD